MGKKERKGGRRESKEGRKLSMLNLLSHHEREEDQDEEGYEYDSDSPAESR